MIGKSLPLQDNYFKTTFLRAPLANQSAFAAEQLIDELAYAAKMDPVAFRLKNIATATSQVPDVALRWKNALESVAKVANWKSKVAASNLSSANVVTGRGVGFGHFANTRVAAVADISVNKKTGKITVNHVYVGVGCRSRRLPGRHAQQRRGRDHAGRLAAPCTSSSSSTRRA